MIRTAARGSGQLLITAGLVILLFASYELWGTGLGTDRAQHKLYSQLTRQWQQQPAPTTGEDSTSGQLVTQLAKPPLGSGIAILRIPRMWHNTDPRVVVEGVQLADLARGPGHYPDSALPGQVGNFAVAGHRATHGNGFLQLNTLRAGDAVVVETRTTWFTYRVTTSSLVLPTQVSVVDPVPDEPGATPRQKLLTLTTCDPWYSATHRLIVHGVLATTHAKTSGYIPPALKA